MGNQSQSVILKLTGAIVIDGAIVKAGTLVELTQSEAKDLLRRGKAVLATQQNTAPADDSNEGDGDDLTAETDLTTLKKADLVTIATQHGIEHADKLTKDALVEAIKAKLAETAGE